MNNNLFKTSDFALATTISLWFPVEMIEKTDPRKAIFYFKRDESLDQLVESYWRGVLKVNPLAYFSQLKAIKSRLYEEK